MLDIKDLVVEIDESPILNSLNLSIQSGQTHAIMGPNGSGKSTLSKVLTGDPQYEVKSGQVTFQGDDLLELEPDERAAKGLFLAFQYPVEIPGVTNEDFLKMALNAQRKQQGKEEIDPLEFHELIQKYVTLLEMDAAFLKRSVNHGFSGGEKKRNEILQLLVLDPEFVILDETDSGLDIDALKLVSNAINYFKSKNKTILLITHYQRILNYIQPDHVHVLAKGQCIHSGDASLALELEENGYDGILKQYA